MPIIPLSASAAPRGALVPISSFTTTSATVTIAFNNIPQGYSDLMLVVNSRATGPYSYSGNAVTINNDTTFNYNISRLWSTGYSISYNHVTGDNYFNFQQIPAGLQVPNLFGSSIIHFMNYASPNMYKTVINRSAYDYNGSTNGLGGAEIDSALYRSLSPITSFYLGTSVSYVAGSTFNLYGIRSVNQ